MGYVYTPQVAYEPRPQQVGQVYDLQELASWSDERIAAFMGCPPELMGDLSGIGSWWRKVKKKVSANVEKVKKIASVAKKLGVAIKVVGKIASAIYPPVGAAITAAGKLIEKGADKALAFTETADRMTARANAVTEAVGEIAGDVVKDVKALKDAGKPVPKSVTIHESAVVKQSKGEPVSVGKKKQAAAERKRRRAKLAAKRKRKAAARRRAMRKKLAYERRQRRKQDRKIARQQRQIVLRDRLIAEEVAADKARTEKRERDLERRSGAPTTAHVLQEETAPDDVTLMRHGRI